MEHQEAETVCVHCERAIRRTPSNWKYLYVHVSDGAVYCYNHSSVKWSIADPGRPDTQESPVPREETVCDTCHKPIVFVTKGEEISSGQVRDYYRLAGNGEVYDGTHWHSPAPVPDTPGAIPVCQFCDGPADHKCGELHSCGDCCAALGSLSGDYTHGWVMRIIATKNSRIGVLEAALRDAEEALANSYDVKEFPGDGTSSQDLALARVRAALATQGKAVACTAGSVIVFMAVMALFAWYPLYFIAFAYLAFLSVMLSLAILGVYLSFKEKFDKTG